MLSSKERIIPFDDESKLCICNLWLVTAQRSIIDDITLRDLSPACFSMIDRLCLLVTQLWNHPTQESWPNKDVSPFFRAFSTLEVIHFDTSVYEIHDNLPWGTSITPDQKQKDLEKASALAVSLQEYEKAKPGYKAPKIWVWNVFVKGETIMKGRKFMTGRFRKADIED